MGKLGGVIHALNTLDHKFSWPLFFDPGKVLVGHRRVEHVVEQLRDRPLPARERRKLQGVSGEEIKPPPRAGQSIQHGSERKRGRNRKPIAFIAQACPGYWHIDRDLKGVKTSLSSTLHQLH
jgi:hypothetical protein